MCALGTTNERLLSQCRFIAPFVKQGARVLEIGCATGELAAALQRELPIATYEAIELSPAGEVAAARVTRLHRQTLRDALADGSILPGGFDVVIMSHVLEHIDDIAAEVAAIRLAMTGEGAVFIEVPHGSGNRIIPVDDNVSHQHFFSAPSLTRLMADCGLDVAAIELGARLDARYADSLRVVARRFAPPVLADLDLSAHPAFARGRVVVWGAGSLAAELLGNYLDPEKILFFVDRNPAKHGTTCLGRPVSDPEALRDLRTATILVNSIDFAEIIENDIAATFPHNDFTMVRIGDIIDHLRDA